MCLAYSARPSTQDVDALFRPAREIHTAAAGWQSRRACRPTGLDGVKDFSGARRVHNIPRAGPSARDGGAAGVSARHEVPRNAERREFHNEDDVRYLLRHLDIRSYEQALTVITRYYPVDRFPQKTLYALAELLPLRA